MIQILLISKFYLAFKFFSIEKSNKKLVKTGEVKLKYGTPVLHFKIIFL